MLLGGEALRRALGILAHRWSGAFASNPRSKAEFLGDDMTKVIRAASLAWSVSGATLALLTQACGVGDAPETDIAQRRDALEVAAAVIGTDPPVASQYSTGGYLSVATDGDTAMVVFYDGGEIRGMRYDTEGTLLDLEEWLPLGRNDDDAGTHAYTDLAYGDGVYLALYSDSTEGERGIYVQAVSVDGTILSKPVLVGPDGFYGSVAYNGDDFTVAWSNGDVGLARVGLDGQVVAGSEIYVTDSGGTNRPILAMAGDVGLVAFEAEVDGVRRVYAARFDAEGKVLDPGGMLVSDATTSSVDVSAAATDDEFLVIWTAGSSEGVYGSIVSVSGIVTEMEFPVSRSTGTVGGSSVAFDGSNYLVAWQDSRDGGIWGTRLAPGGMSVDPEDVSLEAPARASQSWDIDLAWGGDRYALAFVGDGVEGRFVDDELNVLAPNALQLSALPSAQNIPSSAYNGETYVLGWSDERDQDAYQFRAGRIDDAGNRLDPDGLSVSPVGERVGGVAVASTGESTLLSWYAWGDEPAAYKRVLDADGNLSEPEVWLSGRTGGGVLSSNGDSYLSLYSAGDNGVGNDNEIWGQWFDAAGELSGEPRLLVTISRPRSGLWSFGNEHLLAYSGQEAGGEPITGSVLTFDSEGMVTGEYEPVVEGMLSASGGASDEHFLFTWQDDSDALWGRILTKGEGFGEPFMVSDQVTADTAAVAWDGSTFVVVWPEEREAMWTRNIGADGAMSEPERLFSGDYGWVRLTPGPEGQMLLTYVRWLEWARSRRIESRLVGALGDGVAPLPGEPDAPVTDPPGGVVDEPADTAGGPADAPSQPEDATTGLSDTEDPDQPATGLDDSVTPSSGVGASSGTTAGSAPVKTDDAVDGIASQPSEMGASGEQGATSTDSGGSSGLCSVRAPGHRSSVSLWCLALLGVAACRRRRGMPLTREQWAMSRFGLSPKNSS